jgi:hypothetical protein
MAMVEISLIGIPIRSQDRRRSRPKVRPSIVLPTYLR